MRRKELCIRVKIIERVLLHSPPRHIKTISGETQQKALANGQSQNSIVDRNNTKENWPWLGNLWIRATTVYIRSRVELDGLVHFPKHTLDPNTGKPCGEFVHYLVVRGPSLFVPWCLHRTPQIPSSNHFMSRRVRTQNILHFDDKGTIYSQMERITESEMFSQCWQVTINHSQWPDIHKQAKWCRSSENKVQAKQTCFAVNVKRLPAVYCEGD